ncbi:MAG: FimB/Mfa2 family fimbrial subunit [Prevotella sp.]|nr:FimB/Mfa2 family fimbrial subunit [Prevotella sp.]
MKRKTLRFLYVALCAVLLSSCEKTLQGGDDDASIPSDANVVLKMSLYEDLPFDTRSSKPISQMASRISVAFFQGDTKAKAIWQKADDDHFGTVATALAEGSYEVVAIAHNSDGTATITSPEKVTFPSNKISDTFYYYGTLNVSSTQSTFNLDMKRNVAMFRLIQTVPLPETAKYIWFRYTGGSSTYSPVLGFGCVKSTQTAEMEIAEGQDIFEIYTFPHEEEDVLNITIRLLDSKKDAIKELTLENVPVTLNRITQYTGDLMNASSVSGNTFNLTGDDEWNGTENYTF